jgi:hypothetical protein
VLDRLVDEFAANKKVRAARTILSIRRREGEAG